MKKVNTKSFEDNVKLDLEQRNLTNKMKNFRDYNLYMKVRTLHEYLIIVHNEFLRVMLKDQDILERLRIRKDYQSVREDKDYDSSKFTSKDLSNFIDNISNYSENINRVHDVIEEIEELRNEEFSYENLYKFSDLLNQ